VPVGIAGLKNDRTWSFINCSPSNFKDTGCARSFSDRSYS